MKTIDKKNLINKYTELRKEIVKTLLENSDCEIDIDGDIVDKLQGQSLANIQNRLCHSKLTKLRALDSAIDGLTSGDYGDCEECGEPIGMKRLEILPGVTTCVCCAELAERR